MDPSCITDPSLLSTWSHCAWFTSGCVIILICIAKSITATSNLCTWVELILSNLVGYVLADLATGIYHWSIDNYGCAKTPIFGSQIESFQGHHQMPWAITKRQIANNLHGLARATTLTVLPTTLLYNDPAFLGFLGVFAGCLMFSQQLHAWAHCTKDQLPQLVVALQDVGIIIPRLQHACHHRPPYNSNYCIVSGMWNKFLDKSRFFLALEVILFFTFGVRPRSWTGPI